MSAFLLAWCATAIGFTVTALFKTRRTQPATPRARPAVILLRPVDAPTDTEVENLRHAPASTEQWVLSPTCPPGCAGWWVASHPKRINRKLGHLQNALAKLALDQPVVIADADVRVDDALVEALLAGLESGAALTWAAPAPVAPGLERGLLVQSAHSFEVLDAMSPGSSPLCGKAMALSPQALEVLRILPDCVGEDLELSKELHAYNLQTRLVARAQLPGARPASAAFARFSRWMQVLRAHRGALFPSIPLFFACTPVLLAASVVGPWSLRALVGLLFVARMALAWRQEGRVSLWWLPGEALLFASWVRALWLGQRVTWRGRTLQLGPAGALREVTR